jgi:hypothetical protein
MQDLNSVIANTRCVFSVEIASTAIPQGHILMNAPRPLLGESADINCFLHGRYFVLLDSSDPYAALHAAENLKLDAYLVLPTTRAHITEMALEGCKYEAEYRAMAEDERWSALSSRIDKLQRLTLTEATAKLDRATAKLALPVFQIHAILAIDLEHQYQRRMPDYKLASTLLGRTVAYDPRNPDVTPMPFENEDDHQNLTPGDVYHIDFEVVYSKGSEQLSLGFHPILGNAERAVGIFNSAGRPS